MNSKEKYIVGNRASWAQVEHIQFAKTTNAPNHQRKHAKKRCKDLCSTAFDRVYRQAQCDYQHAIKESVYGVPTCTWDQT